MKRFLDELKHAFAVDKIPKGQDTRLPEPLDRLAKAVVERGMEAPAIILLETVRPLNFLTGQAMLAAWPLVRMAADGEDYREVAESLEDRRMLGNLVARIEQLAFEKGAGP
jgi:hypothetical protein